MKATAYERMKARRAREVEEYIESHPDRFESLPGEVFLDIPGYEDEYQISNKGRVKSLKTKRGRIMRLKKIWSGYVHVCLCQGNVKRHHAVHGLVLESFVSRRPEGYVANHKDGDKANNDLSNLEWVTQSENAKHSYYILGKNEHCVPPRFYGEDHPMSVAKDEAERIKSAYGTGFSSREVSRQFGISKTTVLKIVNNKHWSS
jgi:hypothetical protein